MRLFSSSLSAFAFAVLWPVALLAIAVFCAWLERRTLLPPQAAGNAPRRPAASRPAPPGRPPAQQPPPAAPAAPPAEPRPAAARPGPSGPSGQSGPVPPLPPTPPDAQSFADPGEVLGKYPPLGGTRPPRAPGHPPGQPAERPPGQRRP